MHPLLNHKSRLAGVQYFTLTVLINRITYMSTGLTPFRTLIQDAVKICCTGVSGANPSSEHEGWALYTGYLPLQTCFCQAEKQVATSKWNVLYSILACVTAVLVKHTLGYLTNLEVAATITLGCNLCMIVLRSPHPLPVHKSMDPEESLS